ncbi:MAG TPA: hypothetical protein VMS98_18145 [Thermoanaerobaculia bacterium]|nr:hypothetical protein [Thermoanaerobaculia bacterium]
MLVSFIPGCTKEDDYSEPEAFSFVVYPGARYLGKLTELTKQAHKVMKPNEEPPPVAIYDTEASVEEVANFYARSYGYSSVAPDSTNNLSAAKPPAYYRSGDLAADNKALENMLPKLNLNTDVSKAVGEYKAAEIEPRPNRPRVTVQRPYFDATTSQVLDRTLVLMSR